MRYVLVFWLVAASFVAPAYAQMMPFPGGGASVPSITETAHTETSVKTNSYSFAGLAIGTAAVGRRVIVGCAASGAGLTAVSSLTVGGVAATSVVSQTDTSSASVAALYIIQVDTGTTATVAVTFNAASSRGAGCVVWAAYNIASTPTQTGSSTASPLATTLNISAGGVAVGYAEAYDASIPTYTWAGLTESVDATIDAVSNYSHTGSQDAFATAQTALAISATPSVTTAGQRAMVAASFR